MKRKYYLIRNASGCTYWSYKATRRNKNLTPVEKYAIAKYGTIYVNRNGGWMPESCAEEILQVITLNDFPCEVQERTEYDGNGIINSLANRED